MMLRNCLPCQQVHQASLSGSLRPGLLLVREREPGAGVANSTQEEDSVVVVWFPGKGKHSLSSRTMKSKGGRTKAAKIREAMLQES